MKINVTNGKQPINLLVEAGTYEKKYKTAEGNPVILTDAWSNYPLKSLGVSMNPIQDLHGYDHPWVGGAGKNLINVADDAGTLSAYYAEFRTTFKLTAGQTYTFSATATSSENPFAVTIGCGTETGGYTKDITSKSYNTDGRVFVTFTPTAEQLDGGEYFKFRVPAYPTTHAGVTYTVKDIQLELGSTATAYEPYENICPISGWSSVDVYKSGVNVWDEEWRNGYYGSNGVFYATPSAPSNLANTNPISVKPSTAYYFKAPNTNSNTVCWYDADMTLISANTNTSFNTVITSPSNARYLNFKANYTGTTESSYNHDISINYPSTDHNYHAYNGQTITKDLGQTVYGCEVDIVSGQMVIDRKYQLLNGSEGAWYNYEYQGVNSFRFIPNDMASVQSTEGVIITNEFTFRNAAWAHSEDYGTFSGSGASIYFRPPNAEITTLADFKTWLASNNLQIVYPLANPQTIQLTPEEVKTLMKETILMTNADSLLVDYRTNER